MTAKEYLNQAYIIDRKIIMKLAKAEGLRSSLHGCGSQFDNTGSQHSNNDKIGSAIAKIVDYEAQCDVLIDKLVSLKLEIENVIQSVEDPLQCEVLERRYLKFQKWERIADDMKLDLRWIYRIHKKALIKLTIESHYKSMVSLE